MVRAVDTISAMSKRIVEDMIAPCILTYVDDSQAESDAENGKLPSFYSNCKVSLIS